MNSEEPPRPEGRFLPHSLPPDVSARQSGLNALAAAISGEEQTIDLAFAALIIAAAHHPGLDVAAYMRKLDELARLAQPSVARFRRPDLKIQALNRFLFEEIGFGGNEEDYYNPANSYLNAVLDTRCGLPITLSIVYIAVAQRLGLSLQGVGLPLHFIVRYDTSSLRGKPDEALFIDPFHQGEFLTPASCQARIETILGRSIAFDPAYLQPTPNRLILYRLLNNLKQVYLRREEPARAGRVVEQMLVVAPDSVDDMRDRGLLYLQERAFSKAVDWLTRYLEQIPDAGDAAPIRRAIAQAYQLRAQLN